MTRALAVRVFEEVEKVGVRMPAARGLRANPCADGVGVCIEKRYPAGDEPATAADEAGTGVDMVACCVDRRTTGTDEAGTGVDMVACMR